MSAMLFPPGGEGKAPGLRYRAGQAAPAHWAQHHVGLQAPAPHGVYPTAMAPQISYLCLSQTQMFCTLVAAVRLGR